MKNTKSLPSQSLVPKLKLHKLKILILGVVLAFSFMSFIILTACGADTGLTGSPNDGSDCTGCHSDYLVNTGSGSASISSNIPTGGYVGGTTYTLTATVNYTGRSTFGFELSPQTVAGAPLGTLHNISTSETKIV